MYLRFSTRNDCNDLPIPEDNCLPGLDVHLKWDGHPDICTLHVNILKG